MSNRDLECCAAAVPCFQGLKGKVERKVCGGARPQHKNEPKFVKMQKGKGRKVRAKSARLTKAFFFEAKAGLIRASRQSGPCSHENESLRRVDRQSHRAWRADHHGTAADDDAAAADGTD